MRFPLRPENLRSNAATVQPSRGLSVCAPRQMASVQNCSQGRRPIFLHAGTYFASIRCHRGSNPGSSFMQKENGQVIETAVEARAGFLDRPTLVVLIVSTGLIIGLFAAIYVGFLA